MRMVAPIVLSIFIGAVVGISGVILWQKTQTPIPFFTPNPTPTPEPERPLLRYTFEQLRSTEVAPTAVSLSADDISSDEGVRTFIYSSTPLERKMTGVVNLPATVTASTSAIIMLRGYVPPNQYAPGVGTKNAARVLAQAGFVTIAPDFFGYGDSEAEPKDEWQARFEKPLTVISLLKGLRTTGFTLPDGTGFTPKSIGLWGHSNGGQIALSSLAILQEPIPTALWAPVTAPFPYSILYFSDEEADEGKQSRKWISLFDNLYDAQPFSFTNYLDGLRGPVQLQQGTNDDAVLKWWSDEFVQKLKSENVRRAELVKMQEKESRASESATETLAPEQAVATPVGALEPITYDYFVYQGADHNMRPDWDSVIAKDVEFFTRELQ